jgi:hypothetical protein
MSGSRTVLILLSVALLGMSLAANSQAQGQFGGNGQPGVQPAGNPRLDRGKNSIIEPAVKGVVKNAFGPAAAIPAPGGIVTLPPRVPSPRLDVGKTVEIEPALKTVVKTATAPADAASTFVNPKVQPGKVRWHPSFAAACEASKKSRKPVMLFQLMGKLDDQFC